MRASAMVLFSAAMSFAIDVCNEGVKISTDYKNPSKLISGVNQYCKGRTCDTIEIIYSTYYDKLKAAAETNKAKNTYLAQQQAGEQALAAGQEVGSPYYVRVLDGLMAKVETQYQTDMAFANQARRDFTAAELNMVQSGTCTDNAVTLSRRPKAVQAPFRFHYDLTGRHWK